MNISLPGTEVKGILDRTNLGATGLKSRHMQGPRVKEAGAESERAVRRALRILD